MRELTADRTGFVGEVSALETGRVALDLGAGRRTKEDAIDHAVGVRCFAKRGDEVETGQVLAAVSRRDEDGSRAGPGADPRPDRDRGRVQPPRPIVLETLA